LHGDVENFCPAKTFNSDPFVLVLFPVSITAVMVLEDTQRIAAKNGSKKKKKLCDKELDGLGLLLILIGATFPQAFITPPRNIGT
jgi:hypothetical protein